MAIYDTTGQVGMAKTAQRYFQRLEDMQAAKEGKAASRKMGLSGAKGIKQFQELMGPQKLMAGGESIFQQQAPTGNLLERVGQKIAGPDLSTAQLTPKATEAGYTLQKEPHSRPFGLKDKKPTVLRKFDPTKLDADQTADLAEGVIPKGEEVAKQFGPGSTKLGSILGAYQVGSGLSTAFDPKASTTRKVSGGVSAALGANSLLAMAGANLWNPMGPAALLAGAGAFLGDMFG